MLLLMLSLLLGISVEVSLAGVSPLQARVAAIEMESVAIAKSLPAMEVFRTAEYDESRVVRGPPSPPTAALFSAGFSDNAVLQRNAKAAVYGIPGQPFSLPASVTVTVTETGNPTPQTLTASVTNESGIGEWKVYLDPHVAGGDYSISVQCTKGCVNSSSTSIKNITFGDNYYCAGQSNMQLILLHTFSRNKTFADLVAGKYDNLRLYQHPQIAAQTPQWVYPAGEASQVYVASNYGRTPSPLQFKWNIAAEAVKMNATIGDYLHPPANLSVLNTFGGICMYFGQALTDIMRENGEPDVPLGLMDVSWGGTMIEQWSTNATTDKCQNTTKNKGSGTLYNGMVAPFANFSLTAWLWYQGENNIGRGTKNPYLLDHMGYACQLPNMISLWRETFSGSMANTTSPMAPFGVVDIHAGGSEGQGGDGAMGNFRWAQTASYGVLPNPAMPRTFMANAYDLGDPWGKPCFNLGCCTDWSNQPDLHNITRSPTCIEKDPNVNGWCWDDTTYYMGPIHARPKQPLAKRLALGAYNTLREKGPLSGPVISSCKRMPQSIDITFNETLLEGDTVFVQSYNSTANASGLQVYINSTLEENGMFTPSSHDCQQIIRYNKNEPVYGNISCWIYADIKLTSPNTISVDVSKFPSTWTIGGIRYAWEDRYGCGDMNMALQPCPFGSHPIIANNTRLPAMPFIVKVTESSCGCVAPQQC
eukprot:m.259407 g.259407  ORF g.259407 m.259407 type:complete len:703 (+) comp16203_c0_seq5:53-2161(+)